MTVEKYPRQMDGFPGCMCRTCKANVALYLDECTYCRAYNDPSKDHVFIAQRQPRDPEMVEKANA